MKQFDKQGATVVSRLARHRVARELHEAEVALQGALIVDDEDGREKKPLPVVEPADPLRCIVSGAGLASATTRVVANFKIEAFNKNGQRKTSGGDRFVAAVRGRGNAVYSKVVDQLNGSYLVEFKPNVSGRYQIAVSLAGTQLPGSPFTCIVTTPTASSPHCILRGPALLNAIARKEEYFEIQFRDANGQIAHAEDLDVYVDVIDVAEQAEILAARAAEEQAAAEAKVVEEKAATKTKKDAREKEAAKKKEEETKKKAAEAANSPSSPFHARPTQRPAGAEGYIPLLKTHECTVTSSKPLVVRAGLEKGSPRLGQLLPGQRLRLLDVVVVEEDGQKTARASVAIVDVSRGERLEIPCQTNWRDLFTVRPAWLEGVQTPRKQPRPRAMSPQLPFGPREPRTATDSQEAAKRSHEGDKALEAIGWVTVHKGLRELVTPREELQASERQRHIEQWARRVAVDKSLAVNSVNKFIAGRKLEASLAKSSSHGSTYQTTELAPSSSSAGPRRKKGDAEVTLVRQSESVYLQELHSDPKGIGFAFGGVEPGRLHAKGELIETHKVHYSIAVCGVYRFHVGLRHDGVELPGSPFLLHVTAGPASALSTRVPTEALPLAGVVGDKGGCELLLQASDKMGNRCTSGSAAVACFAGSKEKKVDTVVVDNNDGTYLLRMRSKYSGTFDVHVAIDGLDVIGSPIPMRLLSQNPDLTQTQLEGEGLQKATAGNSTKFFLGFRDQYGNAADPGSTMVLGMALLRQLEDSTQGKNSSKAEKAAMAERWRQEPPHQYELIADKEFDDKLEVRYTPTLAGNLELYLWILRPENKAMGGAGRELLHSTFFLVQCAAGKAHTGGSSVKGFTRLEVVTDSRGKAPSGSKTATTSATPKRSPARDQKSSYEDSVDVYAGEPILVRPRIRDRLGNPTAAPDGTLSVHLELPDGTKEEMKLVTTIRSGLTNYEIRYEPRRTGRYQMHVNLKDAPIEGSPVRFECIPNYPDVAKSRYILPTDTPALLSHKDYYITVITCDRCGNQLDHGGASVSGRLQSANLPPQQSVMLDCVDLEDGTYQLKINLQSASDLKVIITIDKDRQGEGGGEFPPIPMTFVNLEALNKKAAKQAKQEAMKEQAASEGRFWSMGTSGGDEEITLTPGLPSSPKEVLLPQDDSMGSTTPKSAHDSMENPLSAGDSAGKANAKLKKAGEGIVQGFGSIDGRRGKVSGVAIVSDAATSAAKETATKDVKATEGSASGANTKIKKAGEAILQGFGSSDSRREKVTAVAIVADAAKEKSSKLKGQASASDVRAADSEKR
jgi:hypothetical protein